MLLNQVHEKFLSFVAKSTVGSLEIILGQENTKLRHGLSKTKINRICWDFFPKENLIFKLIKLPNLFCLQFDSTFNLNTSLLRCIISEVSTFICIDLLRKSSM